MKRYIAQSIMVLIVTFCVNAQQFANTLIVNADSGIATISNYIYGHFSEHLGCRIYGGI